MKKVSVVFLLVLVSLLIFSCKSAPKAAEESSASSASASQSRSAEDTSSSIGGKYGNLTSVDEAKAAALAEKEKADSMKAAVAVKEEYAKILNIFNDAETLGVSSIDADRKEALNKYIESANGFAAVYDEAVVRFDAAKAEYEKALLAIQEVEQEAAVLDEEIKAAGGAQE